MPSVPSVNSRDVVKAFEFAWRKLTGQTEKAEKSRVALAGVWRFARHEVLRFWRA